MSEIYIAGFGCRRGCSESSLRELMDNSLRELALDVSQLSGIASIDSKRDEPGLVALAATLGLPLNFFSSAQLAAFDACLSQRSTAALTATGIAGVAEAAALAQAETLMAQQSGAATDRQCAELIIEKRKNGDATFALARLFCRPPQIKA